MKMNFWAIVQNWRDTSTTKKLRSLLCGPSIKKKWEIEGWIIFIRISKTWMDFLNGGDSMGSVCRIRVGVKKKKKWGDALIFSPFFLPSAFRRLISAFRRKKSRRNVRGRDETRLGLKSVFNGSCLLFCLSPAPESMWRYQRQNAQWVDFFFFYVYRRSGISYHLFFLFFSSKNKI